MSELNKPAAWFTKEMGAAFLLFATLPLWIPFLKLSVANGTELLIYATFALGFNLLMGYTGLPSFGHAAFFGVGAYAMGLTQVHLSTNLWIGLLCAIGTAMLIGGIVATFISHRRGIYFSLMTIAFCQVIWFTTLKWRSLTGAEDGLAIRNRPAAEFGFTTLSLADQKTFYFFCLATFCIVILFLWKLVHSYFGKVIRAIKQNEMRAQFVGYNVWAYKWVSFTISAGIAGLAGAQLFLLQKAAYPNEMELQRSGQVVMMTIIGGGLVSFWGPVIGAVIFLLAKQVLSNFTPAWQLWFGLLFMLIVLFKPEGVAGIWQDLRAKFKMQKAKGKMNGTAADVAVEELAASEKS